MVPTQTFWERDMVSRSVKVGRSDGRTAGAKRLRYILMGNLRLQKYKPIVLYKTILYKDNRNVLYKSCSETKCKMDWMHYTKLLYIQASTKIGPGMARYQ